MQHDWRFVGSTMGSSGNSAGVGLAVAICARCGTVRSGVVTPRREQRLDLTGECPGEPQVPEAPSKPRIG
jgi:hypothetical protein